MDFITAILLIVLGILAAAQLIVARAPSSRQAIENLRPAQGVLGLIVCLWGLWTVIRFLMHIDILRIVPFTWIVFFATGVVELLLGFLMGYAVIQRFVLSGSAGASAKGAEMERKLSGIQVPLGVAGIVLGIIALVFAIRYGG
jgi:hypothetical protein